MPLLGIESPWLYVPIYIIIVTIIWPMMVLIVSIPFGQFVFFRSYIAKLGKRMAGKKNRKNFNIAIFASGAGSNAEKIIGYFKDSSSISVALVVCNKPGAGVITIAGREGIPLLMIEKEQFFRGDGYVPELKKAGIDFIILAGFLWKVPQTLIDSYPRRIVNIHPALLPKYGGKGMYGQYVHEAVLQAGEVQSGITIHYVDEHYDQGDIIFQTACPVMDGDTPEKLAHRVHALEHMYYPEVVERVVVGNSQ